MDLVAASEASEAMVSELPIEMWAHILSIVIKEASQSTQAWRVMIPLALVCRDWFALVFSSLSEVDCDTQRIPRTYLPFLFRHAIYLKELILLEGAGDEGTIPIRPNTDNFFAESILQR